MDVQKFQIGNVDLDLRQYSGSDQYSDGDIEEELLKIVKETEAYDVVLSKCENFAIYYHLAKERGFIAEVMNISDRDEVLEIGAGCGAVTGALADRAKCVHCIDLSKRRSLINAYRHKRYDNISIQVCNYEDSVHTKKYDVITLIGVLEYACYYIHTKDPYAAFLMDVRKKLKEDGRIYIAIENRLGLKYFSGCKEDHSGVEFDGIEGYIGQNKARTFSYYELNSLFRRCGFDQVEFYYPYPDYKFPSEIYSDEYYPSKGNGFVKSSNYIAARRECFDEIKFLNSLQMGDEFRIFSNSFLVCLR
ncbi:MAG: class I SAM-dependent methyltransferase [Lachnospiraceae bacterium]|nr:class I SAM-dependent methyltransferase [Lachnospiraceae bacterium]